MNQVDVHPVPELCSDTQHTWAWTNRDGWEYQAVLCPGYGEMQVQLRYTRPGRRQWVPVSRYPLYLSTVSLEAIEPFIYRLAQWTRGQATLQELVGATT